MGRFHRHDDGTVHTHEHAHHGSDHDHGDHSGYETGAQRIDVLEEIFAENDSRANINRQAFERNGIRALNLMSSPGSGKTTVLAATLDELAGEFAIGVIEGDIATDLDAAKLSGRGAQLSLINTSNGFGGECHLDAPMVNRALPGLDLSSLDLVVTDPVQAGVMTVMAVAAASMFACSLATPSIVINPASAGLLGRLPRRLQNSQQLRIGVRLGAGLCPHVLHETSKVVRHIGSELDSIDIACAQDGCSVRILNQRQQEVLQ